MNLLTRNEVAELFKVKAQTVDSWAKKGIITPIKMDGTTRFREDEIFRKLGL